MVNILIKMKGTRGENTETRENKKQESTNSLQSHYTHETLKEGNNTKRRTYTKSIHSFQVCRMSLIEIFMDSTREDAQEAYFESTRPETASNDLAQFLKILLLRSHHKLHIMAKRAKRQSNKHFGRLK